MSLDTGKVYQGFRLLNRQSVEEINSTASVFYHEKSGARVLHLGNDDDNKVFSISFRTPPQDSTGVAHIVEHSVLCGSRKFPTKEPFVELVKGSLNTFLNAMTFPDKTMYPVASRNEKDFRNLMDVYLDAVFYPNIYKDPQILMQEGWHYELDSPEGELTYKGVVYNEMKGVFSSPDAILEHKVFTTLFPDTTYGFESGGDPDVTPQLTQQEFVDFHRRYYHPSNSYIFLYGDMQLEETLAFLDQDYLSNFDKTQPDSEIALQSSFTERQECTFEYPISPAEKPDDKTFLSLNFVVGTATDAELYLAFQILEHMLLETPAAPLRKALIEAGIGKDVTGSFAQSILQPTFNISVTGANEQQKDAFCNMIYRTLETLLKEGINKKLIQSSVNFFEFRLRESNYGGRPKGLMYNIKCMDSWLYDADPLMHLAYQPTLDKIKTALSGNYFETLIHDYLMNNTHCTLLVLKPKQGLAEEKATELSEALADYKAQLSPTQIQELIRQTRELKIRQETADSEEKLATIPLLNLDDIEPQAEPLPLVEKRQQDMPVLLHPLFTNQIVYLNLYFDVRTVPQEFLPYVHLLAELLGKVSTADYDYTALSNEINIHTGGILYDAVAFSQNQQDEVFYPKFRIRAKALVEKLPEMLELLGQIVGTSSFADDKRLKELIQQSKSIWEANLFRNGQQVVASRVLSYFSPAARFNESGLLSFYQFLVELEKNMGADMAGIRERLQKAAGLLFTRQNLLTSVVIEEQDYQQFQQALPTLLSYLGDQRPEKTPYSFKASAHNEGLMTSGKVQYVAKGGNFRRAGYDYTGNMKVLETILRYDYLWTRVRVQGGAYGGFARFERNGNMVFGSYRDPNLQETLTVYDETAEYLRNFQVTGREMVKYIIGTVSQLDTPLTPQMKGERASELYIRKISSAEVQKERDEVLGTSEQDIRNLAGLVDAVMKQNYLCVLGSERKIKANKQIFNQTFNVFE